MLYSHSQLLILNCNLWRGRQECWPLSPYNNKLLGRYWTDSFGSLCNLSLLSFPSSLVPPNSLSFTLSANVYLMKPSRLHIDDASASTLICSLGSPLLHYLSLGPPSMWGSLLIFFTWNKALPSPSLVSEIWRQFHWSPVCVWVAATELFTGL